MDCFGLILPYFAISAKHKEKNDNDSRALNSNGHEILLAATASRISCQPNGGGVSPLIRKICNFLLETLILRSDAATRI
jgi:hypothetical protein